ncbi:hypothetical protein OTK59_12285 [Vibrio natriegens]|uniref:hypothetical protein n=1 Tax=Vibrio natriegens TaxID=691 RepID=UPI0022837C2C|nr:hypothetical protein [Vibrio natriegens]MCY9877334.1 hypothetical protein [Vibrio natriegens]
MDDRYTISLPVFDSCLSASGLCKVTPDSNYEEKQALEKFAVYFKNEMHYDFVQYEADAHKENCIGYLFTENAMDVCTENHTEMPTRCVGGCLFSKVSDTWVLCWVWLHPYFRNKGLLSSAWKTLYNEFGEFSIETPLSPAMKSFLNKRSTTHLEVKISYR